MKEKVHYRRLDYIRIISCILILLYHLNIIKGGFLAVCTFFTISGYLSCLSALKDDNFSIRKYYIKRLKKLYLPLIIVVFITIILIKQFSFINYINLKQETLSVLFGYNNFWQINANLDYFTRHINSPFMHFWYISILMQFDLLFPILFSIFKKLNKKINKNFGTIMVTLFTVISIILFSIFSKNKDIMVVYYNTFLRSFSILMGILLSILTYKYNIIMPKILRRFNKPIFILYLLSLILICIFVDKTDNYALYMILITIISIRLIRYSTFKIIKSRNRLITLLSNTSYEIYLVQYPVIFFMTYIKMNDILKTIITIIITLIISFTVHMIINIKLKNILLKIIRFILFILITIFGIFIIINEKDNTKEMKELEELLNKNQKIIEEKNKDYINNLNKEREQWNNTLKDIENEKDKVAEIVHNLPVIGIGDSVLLGAIDGLYEKFPNGYFDGKVSRSITGSEELLEELKIEGKLGEPLILALANNGDYRDWVIDELMDILENRRIYWIDAVLADDPSFNERFENYVSGKYPNVRIVKWEEASKNHPEYFYADGIHLKSEGVEAYSNVIYDAIYQDYLKEYGNESTKKIDEYNKNIKEKITFYGNDVLVNSYDNIKNKFEKASFNIKNTYNEIYEDIKEKIENDTLEHKVVFIFDSEFKISKDEYKKLIELCNNHEIYICNMTKKDLLFENVITINFYEQIKKNNDYLMADKVHLSKKGNKALASLLNEKLNK